MPEALLHESLDHALSVHCIASSRGSVRLSALNRFSW